MIFSGENYVEKIFSLKKKFKVLPKEDKRLSMQISPIEGSIIANILLLAKVEKVVEIGSLFGYSSMWIASILPESGVLYTIEKSKEHCDFATQNYKNNNLDKKIVQINGNAIDELEKISFKGPFDSVFIDAKKSEYCDYLAWADKNVKKGGIIIADNVFLYGGVEGKSEKKNISKSSYIALQKFNEKISNAKLYDSFIIPLRDGICFAIKKFS